MLTYSPEALGHSRLIFTTIPVRLPIDFGIVVELGEVYRFLIAMLG